MPDKKPIITIAVAILALAIFALPVYADAGIPMLVFVWPASWLLLIPIVLIEALVGVRILKIGYKQAAKLSIRANLISTLVGIPVTWIGLVIFEFASSPLFYFLFASGIHFELSDSVMTVLTSPWITPNATTRLVQISALCLCVPFFFMSVWVEYKVAQSYMRGSIERNKLRKWSWVANALSYGLIFFILIIRLGAEELTIHEPERKALAPYKEKLDQHSNLERESIAEINALHDSGFYKSQSNHSVAEYSKLIESSNKPSIVLYRSRAFKYEAAGQFQAAINDWTKVIELDPMNAEAYYGRSYIYKQLGNLDQMSKDSREGARVRGLVSRYMNEFGPESGYLVP